MPVRIDSMPTRRSSDLSGIRARFGQAMMDMGEHVPADLVENTRASLDASAALLKRWNKAGAGRIGYAYAPRFALSCTRELLDRKSTRLNSSHLVISYAV